MRHAEFEHPRLVEVYDAECTWSYDDDYFMALVQHRPGSRVVDLGCGTGRLAIGLAAHGYQVTGIDPAAASLRAAAEKPGSDRVTWVHGTSSALPAGAFDVALMTSHVAQFFIGDEEWAATLRDLHQSLQPGGSLAFDARDPRYRAWERWNPRDSRRRVALPSGETVEIWTEVTGVVGDSVAFMHHYRFSDCELVGSAVLRFRSEAELRASLADAGFAVESIFGGWRREPVGEGAGELLVVARA